MSDLMLLGVLGMPLPDDPAELDLITWAQVKSRMLQAHERITADAALLKEVRRLFAYVAGDPEWDEETVANTVDWQWVCEVRATLARIAAHTEEPKG